MSRDKVVISDSVAPVLTGLDGVIHPERVSSHLVEQEDHSDDGEESTLHFLRLFMENKQFCERKS